MQTDGVHSFPPPASCGRRLLPCIVDERAQSKHGRPFAVIPTQSNRTRQSFREVSYACFANGINRLTRWILDHVGLPNSHCEPLLYVAAADFRYQLLILAAVKAGYTTFLISPRNSKEAFMSLLQECGVTKLLTTDPPSPAVPVIAACRRLDIWTLPSLEELLDEHPAPQISMQGSWETHRFRPFVHIHSSGTTGIPKVVTLRHGSFSALDGFQLLDSNELAQRMGNARVLVGFPPFHVAGITYSLVAPIWVDSTVVLPPAVPLTADLIHNVNITTRIQVAMLPSSLVVDLARHPEHLETMCELDGVGFSGGPLPEAIGKQIAQKTKLHAGYGASEWNAVPQLIKPREDWAYFCFNEKEGGLEFRLRDEEEELYELVICRRPEYELSQPVFTTFPEIAEFATKDLFAKHPTRPQTWKYVSRLDDIIVFSNGEKLNPVTFESKVTTSPEVKGCVVIGQGRFQASALIEPAETVDRRSDGDEDELISRIWPYIQEANQEVVRHGKVSRDLVFLTPPGKALPRAGKGTIQRAQVNKIFSKEIQDLYDSLQQHNPMPGGNNATKRSNAVDLSSLDATSSSLKKIILEGLNISHVDDTNDLFSLGMDSLLVINLVRAINTARAPLPPIDAKQVYDNPTIDSLTMCLHGERPRRYIDVDDNLSDDDEELEKSWLAMDHVYNELTEEMQLFSQYRRKKKSRVLQWALEAPEQPVIPPDGGKIAWIQVFAMLLVNLNNWGLVNSFGVFQDYYVNELHYAATSAAWIGTLQGSLLLLVGVISGPLFDAGYFRPMLVTASVGLVFGLMMLSLSTEFYQILLSQGVLCGICSGLMYTPSVSLVPVYFKRYRGLALGLATSGGSVGGIIYPLVFRQLLSALGFANAVRVMGAVAFCTLFVAIVLSRPIGSRIRRQLFDSGAFREPYYVWFLCSAFFLLSATFVPFFLGPSFTTTMLHQGESQSDDVIPIINSAQFFGRVLVLWASDHRHHRIFGPELYHFFADFAMSILGFTWLAVHNFSGFIPWLLFYGFFSGMSFVLPAVILPYICPNLSLYGTRLGLFYAVSGLGLLISDPIAAALNEKTGSFQGSQLWTGSCCLIASLLFLPTGLEVRKRRLLATKKRSRIRVYSSVDVEHSKSLSS